jgi:hypothetical protein
LQTKSDDLIRSSKEGFAEEEEEEEEEEECEHGLGRTW